MEEVASAKPLDERGGLVYSKPEVYEGPHHSSDNYAAVYGDTDSLVVDSVAAWEAAWDIGPGIAENELVWAEAMEEWRQHLVAEQESAVTDAEMAVADFKPQLEAIPELGVLPSPSFWMAPELDELQAAYNRDKIPNGQRENVAHQLAELWAFELEDERLRAAGYIWNEELGDYLHPAEAPDYMGTI